MARIILRLLGLGLLVVAIGVPGCQALFSHEAADRARPAHDVHQGPGR